MKLPVTGRLSNAGQATVPQDLLVKFMRNPVRINDKEQLFELMD